MSTNDKQLNLAFAVAPREAFLAPDQVEFAKRDMPLQIGYSQTNSQPTLVRTMLKWLDVKPGQKILDVGSGSAWTSALLAHLTGKGGQVYAVEIVKELLDFGQKNCQKLGLKNISFHQAHNELGLTKFAPYDRILVSASAAGLPQILIDQLKIGGIMVIPVAHDIYVIHKDSENSYKKQVHNDY